MKQPLRHVNFYKRALLQSCLHNLEPDDALTLHMGAIRPAACVTRKFDTGSEGGTFNRLTLDGRFEGVKLEVIVAASDNDLAIIHDEPTALSDYFSDPAVPLSDKALHFNALAHVRGVNTTDLLLHELTGRYVWVFVAVYPSGTTCDCALDGMRLEFPRESFTRYFPEIYQESEFFDRYISIFQSMYLDLERRVDTLPHLLDYKAAPDEDVAELASWVGIDNHRGLFSTAQLRELIQNIDLFQGGKGTRAALERIIELVCKIRPRVVEHFQWSALPASAARRKLNGQLYGNSANQFCVILDLSRDGARLPVDQADLERLINSYSVIGTGHRLVYLRKSSHTDTHCYLDVNSVLSTPETASVDGVSLGSHITVG